MKNSGKAGRRWRLAFGAALGLLLAQAQSTPAQPVAGASATPCREGAPVDSPQACSGQPLDARSERLHVRRWASALPPGRLGRAYAELHLVAGAGEAFDGASSLGRLPRGMNVDQAGVLSGAPREAGTFPFTVQALDGAGRLLSQDYLLVVVGGAPRPPRRPPTPTPAPQPIVPTPAPAPAPPAHQDGVLTIYQLSAADLKGLAKAAPAQTAPAATATGTASPTPSPSTPSTAPATPASPATATRPPAKTPAKLAVKLPSTPGLVAPAPVKRAVGETNKLLAPVNGVLALFSPAKPAAVPVAAPLLPPPRNLQVQVAADPPLNALPQSPGPPLVASVVATPATAAVDLAAKAAPLVDVTYPSRALFAHALAARYPPRVPTDTSSAVVDQARKPIRFDEAPPLAWTPEKGCHCTSQPADPEDKVVYGFVPFWSAPAKPPALKFSRINRIELIGVQLRDDGLWTRPSNSKANVSAEAWWSSISAFAIAAQAHGGQLDLVLQRSDWDFLANQDPEAARELGASAAHNAMKWVQTPLEGRGLRRLLFTFWQDPTHVFDGVTVMFDRPPNGAGAALEGAYEAYFDAFVRTLIEDMQKDGRPFALNIVAPETLGDAATEDERQAQAPFWHAFLGYKKLAETAKAHREETDTERSVYIGTSDISVRLLAPIHEPTQDEKKIFRGSIDYIPDVHGADRVELLRSIVPIVFLPSHDAQQLSDDMIYANQNFGGIGLWPAPDATDNRDIYQRLRLSLVSDHQRLLGRLSLCSFTARFVWQLFLVLIPFAALAYLAWGATSGRPRLWMAACAAVPLIAAGLSIFLLVFDPRWAALKVGNLPLFLLLAVLAVGGLIALLRSQIPRP